MNDNDKQPGPDGGGNNWMKNLVIWVGILVALALVVSLVGERSGAAPGKSLSYSAFLTQVKEGSVAKVEIAGTVVNGTLKDNSTFRTNLPAVPDPQLIPTLTAGQCRRRRQARGAGVDLAISAGPVAAVRPDARRSRSSCCARCRNRPARARWASARAAPRC